MQLHNSHLKYLKKSLYEYDCVCNVDISPTSDGVKVVAVIDDLNKKRMLPYKLFGFAITYVEENNANI